MYYLKDKERKFILFWSPRVACMSLKYWYRDLTGIEMAKNNMKMRATYEMLHTLPDYKKIIVIRNPIDRFASILNHLIIFRYIYGETPGYKEDWANVKYRGKERISVLLDFIEKNGTTADHHFELQSFSHDCPMGHTFTNIAALMTDIIKLEEGSLIPNLNKIVGVETKDYQINKSNHFNRLFDDKEIEYIGREDFTEEHINRIKKLYHYDFKYFYNDELNSI